MQAGRSAIVTAIAAIVLVASLGGLWFVLPGNGEVRVTGETLTAFAREHPPKPWRGFETSILDVSVDSEVRIKAHVTGYMIHTPIVISGTPQFDAGARAMFFRVSKVELPREAERPMLGRFNSMLSPLRLVHRQASDGGRARQEDQGGDAGRGAVPGDGEIGARGWQRLGGRGPWLPRCNRRYRPHAGRPPLRRLAYRRAVPRAAAPSAAMKRRRKHAAGIAFEQSC